MHTKQLVNFRFTAEYSTLFFVISTFWVRCCKNSHRRLEEMVQRIINLQKHGTCLVLSNRYCCIKKHLLLNEKHMMLSILLQLF